MTAEHTFAIISIVALILRHRNSWAYILLFFFGLCTSTCKDIFSTRGVFDTETGEMLPQATTPLPIADALLDLDEKVVQVRF